MQCGRLGSWLLGNGVTAQTQATVLIRMLENCAVLWGGGVVGKFLGFHKPWLGDTSNSFFTLVTLVNHLLGQAFHSLALLKNISP